MFHIINNSDDSRSSLPRLAFRFMDIVKTWLNGISNWIYVSRPLAQDVDVDEGDLERKCGQNEYLISIKITLASSSGLQYH